MPTQITTTGAERRRDALRAVMSDARRDDDEDDDDDDARAARVHAGIARGNTMRRALTLRRPGADAASVDEDETDDDDDDDDANARASGMPPSRQISNATGIASQASRHGMSTAPFMRYSFSTAVASSSRRADDDDDDYDDETRRRDSSSRRVPDDAEWRAPSLAPGRHLSRYSGISEVDDYD